MDEDNPQGRHGDRDAERPTELLTPGGSLLDDLLMAIRFYSRLPTGPLPHRPPDLDRMAIVLPFASFIIGLAPALILIGASLLGLPRLFAAGLAVGAAVLVSGGMAEDAIADAADGLFGGTVRERRLEIMKDSRHGTYGVAALCLFLLLRVAALSSMTAIEPFSAGAIWLAAMLMARSGALWLTLALPPARASGASAAAGRVTIAAFGMGTVFALILGLVLSASGAGLIGFVAATTLATAVALGWTALCRRLIGGQTGDLIGALQALLEIAALTGYLLFF
ncbi:MAG: adenosylcobinamide-GDP ribazoletransferase [Devosia sp.]|nr:adenosylcobinamide-GDP ribazoletransferase [Devosia sp.]